MIEFLLITVGLLAGILGTFGGLWYYATKKQIQDRRENDE